MGLYVSYPHIELSLLTLQQVSLMRAARTDAGVSAAINVLNIKLILNPPSLPIDLSLEAHINHFLPPAVRIWSIIRVQGGFHARIMCDSRVYNYSLPTYCFLEPKDGTLMGQRVSWKEGERQSGYWNQAEPEKEPPNQQNRLETAIEESDPSSNTSRTGAPPLSAFAKDQVHRKNYRMQPEVLSRLRQTISKYSGSHNFWNFTVGKEFGDRSCQRVMKDLVVSDPFIVGGNEWISLKFHGQSFMLHQIRKMVGLLIMLVRTRTPASLVPETFGPTRLNIPKAPALGLLLEQPCFESYNRKVIDINSKIKNGSALALDFTEEPQTSPLVGSLPPETPQQNPNKKAAQEDTNDALRYPIKYDVIKESVDEFIKKVVVKGIHDEEEKDDTFAKWLNLHDNQLGTDFE